MMRSIPVSGLLAGLMLCAAPASDAGTIENLLQASGSCKYYAYVSYGPAMVNGNLDEKENAYYNSGLRKYATTSFRAVYTSYNQTTLGNGFTIETIGPFDTEAVAYQAMTSFVNNLGNQGYVEKSSRHTFPAVILRNAEQRCD